MSKAEYIGEKVLENRERTKKWIEENRPIWVAEGEKLKKLRKKLNVAYRDIADRISVSIPVLIKLEAGEPIERRPLVYSSYRATLELILAERRLAMYDFLNSKD